MALTVLDGIGQSVMAGGVRQHGITKQMKKVSLCVRQHGITKQMMKVSLPIFG